MRTLTHKQGRIAAFGLAAVAAAVLVGCSGGSTGDGAVTVEGNVPIVYAKRSTAMTINPTNGSPFAPGGDLILREKAKLELDPVKQQELIAEAVIFQDKAKAIVAARKAQAAAAS